MGVRASIAASVVVVAMAALACSDQTGETNTDDGPDAIRTMAAGGSPVRVVESPCSGGWSAAPGDTGATLSHGGLDRTYTLRVPPQYDGTTPLPLVLNLHGFGSNARQQATYSRFPAKADEAGFVLVTPDGAGAPQRWNNIGLAGEADDIGFLGALLDEMERTLCIDPARMYAAGISNGSAMSQRLACGVDGRIAAVGAVAAFVYPLNCANERPVPIIAFHGTADSCVPYAGGTTACGRGNLPVPPVETSAANWARHNGCASGPQRQGVSDHVERIVYAECGGGSAVELYRVEGGGHTWPGSADVARLGPVTREIDATELMWAFFDSHPRPR